MERSIGYGSDVASGPLGVLGEFVAGLSWNDLPLAVRHRAALGLRDTVGVMVGGEGTTAGALAHEYARTNPGSISVPGNRTLQSTATGAAFASAVYASALDFDDGHYLGGAIHPSSVIVPALLVAMQHGAIALQHGETDHQAFTVAQVAGYEIGLRAAHLLWPRHEEADYHCTGTAATLGAAAAAAKLHGADADEIARAIAVAWAHAPVSTFQLPMVKESIGWSCVTAIAAADLARLGFMKLGLADLSSMAATFPPTPFHRPGAMDEPFVASLGSRWETLHTYFKPYAACRYTHTALRSLQQMLETGALNAAEVKGIEVHTPRPAMNLSDPRPASLDHAQYSFPFVLATMLLTGAAAAAELSDASLTDPERLALAALISVHHDPALDASYPQQYASRLVVRLRTGTVLEETRFSAPGDADDPMTEAALEKKFRALTNGASDDYLSLTGM